MSEKEYDNLIEEYSNVVDELHDTLNDKDQQISDLQAKVKELEEQKDLLIKSITKYSSSVSLETENVRIETDEQRYNILVHLINELGKERYENDQLKHQLRELPKKIVDEIKELSYKHELVPDHVDEPVSYEYHIGWRKLENLLINYEEGL